MQIHKNISERLPARDQRLQNIVVQHTANGLYTETRKVQNSCPYLQRLNRPLEIAEETNV